MVQCNWCSLLRVLAHNLSVITCHHLSNKHVCPTLVVTTEHHPVHPLHPLHWYCTSLHTVPHQLPNPDPAVAGPAHNQHTTWSRAREAAQPLYAHSAAEQC